MNAKYINRGIRTQSACSAARIRRNPELWNWNFALFQKLSQIPQTHALRHVASCRLPFLICSLIAISSSLHNRPPGDRILSPGWVEGSRSRQALKHGKKWEEMRRDDKRSLETGDDGDDKKLIETVRVCVSQKQYIESWSNHDSRGPGTLVAAPRTPKSRPLSLRKRLRKRSQQRRPDQVDQVVPWLRDYPWVSHRVNAKMTGISGYIWHIDRSLELRL